MQLFDMFGEPPQFTAHEMMMVLRSGVFLKYAAAVVLLLVAFDTHGYREAGMPLQANILIWVVCVAAFVLVYAAVLLGWLALVPGGRRIRLLRLVPNATAMAVVTVMVLAMASGLADLEFSRRVLLQHLPYNIALSYIFETLMFVFILPQAGAALGLDLYRRKRPGGEQPVEPRSAPVVPEQPVQPLRGAAEGLNGTAVVVGGQKFALEQLRYVKSEEHYLRVSAGDSELTLRGRLADLLAQMPQDAGLQPHRSWWVARDAVAGLRRGGQSDVLLLADGTEVPVARGRRAHVREVMQAWQAGAD